MEVERDDLSQLEQESSQRREDKEKQEHFQRVPPQVISSTSNMVPSVVQPSRMTTSFNSMFGRTRALIANEIETSMTARPCLERGTGKEFLKNIGIKQQLVQNSREIEEGNIVMTNIAKIFIMNGLVNTKLIERINTWDMRSAVLIPTVVNTAATTPSSGKWGGPVTDITKEITSTDLLTIKEFVANILTYDEDGDQEGLA